ncbi:MAG: hypothetical protein JKY22_12175 [Flavobacteriaceae bacterium]|nr:hypothetical protein [Flavobacteriaceae bacterium]
MMLPEYIKRKYGTQRGALQAFADDIGRPYQSVQRWIRNKYRVEDGRVVKKQTVVVCVL